MPEITNVQVMASDVREDVKNFAGRQASKLQRHGIECPGGIGPSSLHMTITTA
jgi:hypothetical protein